jgi:hypothetical protein
VNAAKEGACNPEPLLRLDIGLHQFTPLHFNANNLSQVFAVSAIFSRDGSRSCTPRTSPF